MADENKADEEWQPPPRIGFDQILIIVALILQAVCALFFITDILSSYVAFLANPLAWQLREVFEIAAAIGLVVGFILGAVALNRSSKKQRDTEARMRLLSGAFMDVVEENFAQWGLTPAERDVAFYAIKGFSTQEIAQLRQKSNGTIKAQVASIYRKAGVGGRGQFFGLFIDDMIDETLFGERSGLNINSAPQYANVQKKAE